MISDEELAQLPEDPTLAFVEFERTLRAFVNEEDLHTPRVARKLEYINKVLAAVDAYDIIPLIEWKVPSPRDNIEEIYRDFTTAVDYFTTRVRIKNAPRDRQNSVALDGNTKAIIHHYIQRIREDHRPAR